jgi:phosphoenolpyruvate carboxykinase (GTP)
MTPRHGDLIWDGLDFGADVFLSVMAVDRREALDEAEDQKSLFDRFGDRVPREMERQRQALIVRLEKAPPEWRPAD